jgi:long-chain acyl-CoA synthetase
MDTIPELIADVARRYGERPALGIRRGLRTERWSYLDVERGMRRAAENLAARGVGPGDRVMVLAPNSPELVLSMLGAWAAGAILVPIDLRTPPEVMARIAEQTAPRLMLTEGEGPLPGLATVSPGEVTGERGQVTGERRTLSQTPESGSHPLTPSAVATGEGASSAAAGLIPGLAEVVFTSGTTGAPKGVILTHANILANVAAAQEALPIAVGENLLSLLPLSHMMEQTAGLLAALAAGATIYYATSRRSSAILSAFQRHRIGLLICVPEVLALLMAGIEREVDRSGRRQVWDRLNAVAARLPMKARPFLFGAVHRRLGGRFRMALCGGAPLSDEVQGAWERLGVRAVQGYGATECAPIVASNRYDRRLSGSVGWPLPKVQIKLAADGEVLVRGPNVTPGYWRDPEATAASFVDGWYRTGDLGERGPDGSLRLRGRKKEMIVLSDGRNVFPEDVEPTLRADPAIQECTVVGKPRAGGQGGGAEVHAVIVPAPVNDGVATETTVEARVAAAVRRANGQLGPQQQIAGWSLWPDPDFPRTPSLKVKRGEVLAAIVADRREAPATAAVPALAGDTLQVRVAGLLARATGRPADRIHPDSDLMLDLGLDSLGRVELAVLLEEELGTSLSDEQVAELRTVADLLKALAQPARATPPDALPGWPRSAPVVMLRTLLQDTILLPGLHLVERPQVIEGQARLAAMSGPALLVANHASHLDSLTVLSALPRARRRCTAVAAAADYFFTSTRKSLIATVMLGAFPFHRTGPVAASLAHCGDLADDGASLLVFPEGTRSVDGTIAPFKPGIGLLARELGLPVVPVYLEGLYRILPKGRSLPRPGPVRVRIGEPLRVDPSLSNAEAASLLEAALRALAAPDDELSVPSPARMAADKT